MGQVIIIGRNGNYPTTETLPELSMIPDVSAPYPEAMMRCLPKRNMDYPKVASLPELNAIPDTYPPYPEAMMRCLGAEINEGYPCVASVEGAVPEVFSKLFFGGLPVTALYYNGQLITSAYCAGEKVYELRYLKNNN